MFCTKCGKQLSGQEAFCPSCGAPVPSGEELSKESSSTSITDTQNEQLTKKEATISKAPISSMQQSGTTNACQAVQTSEASASQATGIERVIGKNSSYYLTEFKKYKQEEKTKFNWAAFFLGLFFCIYRKCWEIAKKYYLLPVILLILSTITVSIGTSLFSLPVITVGAILSTVSSLWMFISCIRLGKHFNGDYCGHCQTVLAVGNEKKYGTSVGVAVLSVIALSIVLMVPNTISRLWRAKDLYEPSETPIDGISTNESSIELPSWCSGTYYGEDIYSTITFFPSGNFDVSVYRMTDITNCVVTEQNGQTVTFTGTFNPSGDSMSGVLENNDDGMLTLSVIESDWSMYPAGESMDFYYDYRDPNYISTPSSYSFCGVYASPNAPEIRALIWDNGNAYVSIMVGSDTSGVIEIDKFSIDYANDCAIFYGYEIGSEVEYECCYDPEDESLTVWNTSDETVSAVFFRQYLD